MESETLMTDKLSATSHAPIPYLGFDSGKLESTFLAMLHCRLYWESE